MDFPVCNGLSSILWILQCAVDFPMDSHGFSRGFSSALSVSHVACASKRLREFGVLLHGFNLLAAKTL